MDKIEVKRLAYTHQGRTIYEWEQTLEELHVYIRPPPGVTAKMVSCTIRPGEMTLGIKGNPPFLSERFESGVNSDESMCVLAPPRPCLERRAGSADPQLAAARPSRRWCMEDGELHIILTKVSRGVPWSAVFQGHTKAPRRGLWLLRPGSAPTLLRRSQVDPFTQSEVQKSLMLERFQEENPGFDFSGATFNGQVPDPKTFMGGVGYK